MLLSMLAALALQATPTDSAGAAMTPADTPTVTLDSAILAGAYLDAGARELVERARARRRTMDRSIRGYETIAREHLSAGLRAGWLERLIYRREAAARIEWRRGGPVRVEVLGARQVAPSAATGARVPGDLENLVRRLAFDPADGAELFFFEDDGVDGYVHHPLAPGSEAYYRFRSGDTTEVQLPEGRAVRLIELEVLPRRASPSIVRGVLSIDADTHSLVRARFRLSEDINTGRWNLSFGTTVRRDSAGVDTVRTISFGAEADIGRGREPEMGRPDTAAGGEPPRDRAGPAPDTGDTERAVESEEEGDIGFFERTALRLGLAMVPDVRAHLRYATIDYGLWERRWWLPRLVAVGGVVEVAGIEAPLRYEWRYGAYRVTADSTPGEGPAVVAADSVEEVEVIVVVPDDTASLLTSEHLPPDAFAEDAGLIDDAELDALLGDIGELSGFAGGAGAPWRFAWSNIDWDPLIRYNRVEALSVGIGAEFDPGPIGVSARMRLGTGDVEPRGALSWTRRGVRARYELTGYRRLRTMDPRAKAFSNVASAAALLFGYDEPDYYDVLGVSLAGRPPAAASPWYEWRLYAQREDAVRKETDFNIPHLFDDRDVFRANPAAAEAAQYGAELALRRWWGRDPDGLRGGGSVRLGAATGDFTYARPSLTLRTTFPLPGPIVGALEAEAGAVWGEPALQHLRRVGGTSSVRGYHGSARVGESSWRLRAELATRLPAARLVLFSDAGWAGPLETFGEGEPLTSVGIGAGFFDGFIRADVARALAEPTGWRVAFYVDGPL